MEDLRLKAEKPEFNLRLPEYITSKNFFVLKYLDTRYLNIFGLFPCNETVNQNSLIAYQDCLKQRLALPHLKDVRESGCPNSKDELYGFNYPYFLNYVEQKYNCKTPNENCFQDLEQKASSIQTRLRLRRELAFSQNLFFKIINQNDIGLDDAQTIIRSGDWDLFRVNQYIGNYHQDCDFKEYQDLVDDLLPNIVLKAKTIILDKVIADCQNPHTVLHKKWLHNACRLYNFHEADKLASCNIFLEDLPPEEDIKNLVNKVNIQKLNQYGG